MLRRYSRLKSLNLATDFYRNLDVLVLDALSSCLLEIQAGKVVYKHIALIARHFSSSRSPLVENAEGNTIKTKVWGVSMPTVKHISATLGTEQQSRDADASLLCVSSFVSFQIFM